MIFLVASVLVIEYGPINKGEPYILVPENGFLSFTGGTALRALRRSTSTMRRTSSDGTVRWGWLYC